MMKLESMLKTTMFNLSRAPSRSGGGGGLLCKNGRVRKEDTWKVLGNAKLSLTELETTSAEVEGTLGCSRYPHTPYGRH